MTHWHFTRRLYAYILGVIFFVSFFVVHLRSSAMIGTELNAQRLIDKSDLVIVAEVSVQRSYIKDDQNGKHIYTEVSLLPLKRIKGVELNSKITVEIIGGTFEGWREEVSYAPLMKHGEVAVLFLKSNPYRLVADRKAKLSLRDEKFTLDGCTLTVEAFSKAMDQFESEGDSGKQLIEFLKKYADRIEDFNGVGHQSPTEPFIAVPISEIPLPGAPRDLGGGQLSESELSKKKK
jgi:hypothetical protein